MKPKGKHSKKTQAVKRVLVKNLCFKFTQDELKGLYNDATEISFLSQYRKNEGNAYIEFPKEVDEEKSFEEKQGTEFNR